MPLVTWLVVACVIPAVLKLEALALVTAAQVALLTANISVVAVETLLIPTTAVPDVQLVA